jgi:hypothetical protein
VNNCEYHAAHEWIHEAQQQTPPSLRQVSLVHVTQYFSTIRVNNNFPIRNTLQMVCYLPTKYSWVFLVPDLRATQLISPL